MHWALLGLGVLTLWLRAWECVRADWVLTNPQPGLNAAGQLVQYAQFSMTPNVFARTYVTSFQYSGAECSPGACTGTVTLQAPYYMYQAAIDSIVPSATEIVELINYRTNNLAYSTSSNIPSVNTTLPQQSIDINQNFIGLQAVATPAMVRRAVAYQAAHQEANRPYQVKDYKTRAMTGARIFRAMSITQQQQVLQRAWDEAEASVDPAGRKLNAAPNIAGTFNSDFSNCYADASYCQSTLNEAALFASQDYQVQTSSLNVARLNGLLAQQLQAGQAYLNVSQNQLAVIQDQTNNAQLFLNNSNNLLTALNATNDVLAGINKTEQAQADAASNLASSFFNQMDQLATVARINLGEATTIVMADATHRQFLQDILNMFLTRVSINQFHLAGQTQQAQVFTSATSNERASQALLINDPAGNRQLTNLQFLSMPVIFNRGRLMLTQNPGVAPLTYTNAMKYSTPGQMCFYYALPTQLNDTRSQPHGVLTPSWVVERQCFHLECDKTLFAQDPTDYGFWMNILQWFGPSPDCGIDPVGSCLCRVHVSYEQSRHPAALSLVTQGTSGADISTVALSPRLAPLVPDVLQPFEDPGFNRSSPTVFQDVNNNVLWMRPYSYRWVYSLPDLENELQVNGGCLKPLVHLTQLPDPTSPTVGYDALGAPPPFPSVTGDFTGYLIRGIPVGLVGTKAIYVAAASAAGLSFNINDTSLASRPLCTADITTAATYQNIATDTPLSSFLMFGVRAHNAWLDELILTLQLLNGQAATETKIYTDHWAFQHNIGIDSVNDTVGPADIMHYGAKSVDGTPIYNIYNRQPIISVLFNPDARSTHLPATISATGTVVWTADDLDKVLPDKFNWVGYPNCMYTACPIHVLTMTNHTVTNVSAAGYDTYMYAVPTTVLLDSPDPHALFDTVKYLRMDMSTTEPEIVDIYNQIFNGNTTRFYAPDIQNFLQSSKTSIWDPDGLKLSISAFIQLLDVATYTVPANSVLDGAQPGSWPQIAIRNSISTSPDLLDATIISKADVQWDLPNHAIKFYPYSFVVTNILIPIPSSGPLSFPAATNGCPSKGMVSTRRTTLQNTEVTIVNTGVSPVGPFIVSSAGCAPFQSPSTTLQGFSNTFTANVPTCDGLQITIASPFIAQPSVLAICLVYTIRGDQINVQTVTTAIDQFVSVTRDPLSQLNQATLTILSEVNNLVSLNGSQALQSAYLADRTIGSNLVFNGIYANLNASITQAGALIDGLFTSNLQDNSILQALFALAKANARQASINILESKDLIGTLIPVFVSINNLLQVERTLLARAENASILIANLTQAMEPLNYMFAALPSNFDWSGPPGTVAQSFLNSNDAACITTFKPPSTSGPAGDDGQCNVIWYDPSSWFSCIRGTLYWLRIALYVTLIFVIIYVFTWFLLLCVCKGPKTKGFQDTFNPFFTCRKPNNFVNTFARSSKGGTGAAAVATPTSTTAATATASKVAAAAKIKSYIASRTNQASKSETRSMRGRNEADLWPDPADNE